jgi:hypothetical protein
MKGGVQSTSPEDVKGRAERRREAAIKRRAEKKAKKKATSKDKK